MPQTLVQPIIHLLERYPWKALPAPDFALNHPREFPLRDPRKKLTFVLDLDETLVNVHAPEHLRSKALDALTEQEFQEFILFLRPGAREFLKFLRDLGDEVEILIWTAASKVHANRCCMLLGGSQFIDAAVYRRNSKEWDIKDLRWLLRGDSRTKESIFFIDDSALHCQYNKGWGLFQIPPFSLETPHAKVSTDNVLFDLRENFFAFAPPLFQKILKKKVDSLETQLPVQTAISRTPEVEKTADELKIDEDVEIIPSSEAAPTEMQVASQSVAFVQDAHRLAPEGVKVEEEIEINPSEHIEFSHSRRNSLFNGSEPGSRSSSVYRGSEMSFAHSQLVEAQSPRSSGESSSFFSRKKIRPVESPRRRTLFDSYETDLHEDPPLEMPRRRRTSSSSWPTNIIEYFPATSLDEQLQATLDPDIDPEIERKYGIWNGRG